MADGHWARQREFRGLFGMRIMLALSRFLGRRMLHLLVFAIVLGYYPFARAARRASEQFFARLNASRHPGTPERRLSSYYHLVRFGMSMVDRFLVWQGRFVLGREVDFSSEADRALICDPAPDGRGRLLITAHLGDVEICRALARQNRVPTVHALIFTAHAARFNAILKRIDPTESVSLISVDTITPATAVELEAFIAAGDYVAIMGDRVPLGGLSRTTAVPFLGAPAPFPQGGFILGSILHCPQIGMVAVSDPDGVIRIHACDLGRGQSLTRRERGAALGAAVARYVRWLEPLVREHPYEWYNFYDFWAQESAGDKS